MNRVTLTSLRTGLRGTLAYGSPGGTMIIDAVLNVTLNLLGRGMKHPAGHQCATLVGHGWRGQHLLHRGRGLPAAEVQRHDPGCAAYARPHRPWQCRADGCPVAIGSVQGIVIDLKTGRRFGGADARREGTVIGLKPSRFEGPKLDA